ncbi:hypothetical protein EAH81_01320 [Flavobacterium pectinovorum]|uniref:Uncharacterized protein n=2 Tax=Flavobacterium pectinovorum TaxID=29533 RepID=A0A502F7D3_9FLAO|nr:hypothetical protein EAH81_01320 [Flavobacterium pectinovorum]
MYKKKHIIAPKFDYLKVQTEKKLFNLNLNIMENILNPQTRENPGYYSEKKTSPISVNKILYCAAGSFLLGATLKIAGKRSVGSWIAKWALPLLAVGCYKKLSHSSSDSKIEEPQE